MEEFERMTQKTIDELTKAFEEFNESVEDFCSAFDASLEVCMNECQRAAAMKFVDYMHKYVCGTFLTRWYWLRKARKCNDALKGIIQLNNELFKNVQK